MAFLENFDSYTNGTAIDGLNGGTGWGGAWTIAVGSSGAWKVDNTQSVSPSNAMMAVIGTYADDMERNFASTMSAGTFYFSIRVGSGITTDRYLSLAQNTSGQNIIFRINTDGNFYYFNGASYVVIRAYSVNTWYRIGLQWDNANQPNKARYEVSSNGGTEGDLTPWTAYDTANGTFSNIGSMRVNNSNAQTNNMWIDDISNTYTTGGAVTGHNLTLLGVGT